MKIRDFGVEIWMNEFENTCRYNLAETCVASITIEELLTLSGRNDTALSELLGMKMTYGAIEGSERLRTAICGLYTRQMPESIIVTHGTIGANALVYESLVEPGDHVISITPSYQQHTAIPESYGAEVETLALRPEDAFQPDLAALRAMVRPDTRMITLTNPNNPTGALIDEAGLTEIAEMAREVGAWVLCDEVYRGIDQASDALSPSIADLYELGISTSGMSKTFSLAGLRLGWVAGPHEVIEAVSRRRDYNTISVSMINDHFAALALEAKDKILARSRDITRRNLAVLDAWIANEPRMSYVKPVSATVTLLKYDLDMPSRTFCVRLLEETGVMFTPGSALDMEGYVRIGFGNDPDVMKAGLREVSAFLASQP